MDAPWSGCPLAAEPEFEGKFVFLGELGCGGMGTVYKAKQLTLDKFVAIKVIHQSALNEAAVRRFGVEGKAANRFNHPNLVQVWDLDVTASGFPYLIMEYVEGKTLAEMLKEKPQMDENQFDAIFRQLCLGLAHAHRFGVVHRDIKPSNIMIVNNENSKDLVKIMDFGIAKLVGPEEMSSLQLTKTGEMIGSPLYMSPEQARGLKNIDTRSDLYSLGCVMYEALTGLPPFVGATFVDTLLKHQNDPVLPLTEASMGRRFNPRIETMVLKLLQKNPEDRYQSVDEILAAWPEDMANTASDITNGNGTSGNAASKKPRPEHMALAAVLLGVSMLLICGVSVLFKSTHNDQEKPNEVKAKALSPASPERSKSLGAAPEIRSAIVVSDADRKKATQETARSDLRKCVESALQKHPDQTLMLSGCCLENDVSLSKSTLEMLIQNVRGFVDIKKLSIVKSNVKDDDLQSLRKFAQLTTLDLHDDIFLNLLCLKRMVWLEVLDVSGTAINAESIDSLATLVKLRRLDISRTEITSKQLFKLVDAMPSLQRLLVQRCPNVSDNEVALIEKKHPDLSIAYRPYVDIEGIRSRVKIAKFDEADELAAETALRLQKKEHPDYAVLSELESERAEIARMQERYQLAIQRFESALNLLGKAKPDFARSEQLLGRIAEVNEAREHWSAAIEARERLKSMLVAHKESSNNKARLYLSVNNIRHQAIDSRKLGMIDKEKQFSQQCVVLCKTMGFSNTLECMDSLISLGNICSERGQYLNAIVYYEQAVSAYRANSKVVLNPVLWASLGECYFRVGNWSKAEVNFKRYLAIRPLERQTVADQLIVSLERQKKLKEAEQLKAQFQR